MNFKKSTFIILLFLAFAGNAQQISLRLLDSVSFPKNKFERFVGVDTQENLFFLKHEVLTKITKNKELVYSNYELGEPTSVSVINALQILIFYEETNTIILLDRFLNETKRIDLNNLSIPKIISRVENSQNQKVWLLNSVSNVLEVYDYKTNATLSKSIPFLKKPLDLTADFSFGYVLFDTKIVSFNSYGTKVNTTDIQNIEKIKIGTRYVLGVSSESEIRIFNKALKPMGSFKIPKNNAQDFLVSNEKLYIYNGSYVFTYQVNFSSK